MVMCVSLGEVHWPSHMAGRWTTEVRPFVSLVSLRQKVPAGRQRATSPVTLLMRHRLMVIDLCQVGDIGSCMVNLLLVLDVKRAAFLPKEAH